MCFNIIESQHKTKHGEFLNALFFQHAQCGIRRRFQHFTMNMTTFIPYWVLEALTSRPENTTPYTMICALAEIEQLDHPPDVFITHKDVCLTQFNDAIKRTANASHLNQYTWHKTFDYWSDISAYIEREHSLSMEIIDNLKEFVEDQVQLYSPDVQATAQRLLEEYKHANVFRKIYGECRSMLGI